MGGGQIETHHIQSSPNVIGKSSVCNDIVLTLILDIFIVSIFFSIHAISPKTIIKPIKYQLHIMCCGFF